MSMSMTLAQLGSLFDARLEGESGLVVRRAAPVVGATSDDIALVASEFDLRRCAQSKVRCAFVPLALQDRCRTLSTLGCSDPEHAFSVCARYLRTRAEWALADVHPTAIVHPTARLEAGAVIGPHCIVGAGAQVGPHVLLLPRATIGAEARLGKGTVVGVAATVGAGVCTGSLCEFGAGAVIGAENTCYEMGRTCWERQLDRGGLVIGDDVCVGPHSVIERGSRAQTVVESGAMIGGQVYIAHDVFVGYGALLIAQVGVASHAHIGRWATLLGKVAVNAGVHVGDGAVVLACSAVFGNVPERAQVLGFPARPRREALRRLAAMGCVDQLRQRLAKVESALGLP